MDTQDKDKDRFIEPRSGRAFAGLILVVVGAALLSRQMGVDIPDWALTWETLIIVIGLFFGARRMFRPGTWMIMVAVGAAFVIDHYTDISIHEYIWPLAIIFFGLLMILRPRRRRKRDWKSWSIESDSTDDTFEINSVFGGSKKKVMSKDFQGGEINTVFGGNDIDFSQADFNSKATIEVNIVFGGTKLIVPAHWKIQSNVDCVFGTVEDKRRDVGETGENKTLVLKGAVVFGSIEIKSY
jgi:predicted membrane protein